jgi:hypothetical protein
MANQPSPDLHVWSFGRFDETLDLVEKASALTPDRSNRLLRPFVGDIYDFPARHCLYGEDYLIAGVTIGPLTPLADWN